MGIIVTKHMFKSSPSHSNKHPVSRKKSPVSRSKTHVSSKRSPSPVVHIVVPGKSKNAAARYSAAKLYTSVERLYDSQTITGIINILIIERAPGHSLEEWLTSSLYTRFFTPEEKDIFDRDVALQIAKTLIDMKKK